MQSINNHESVDLLTLKKIAAAAVDHVEYIKQPISGKGRGGM